MEIDSFMICDPRPDFFARTFFCRISQSACGAFEDSSNSLVAPVRQGGEVVVGLGTIGQKDGRADKWKLTVL